MCAKLRTVAASNNRVHMPRSLYYCLFAPSIYIVVLRAHPLRSESHNQHNANGEVATTSPSFYNEPHQSYVLCVKAEPDTTFTILVTAPLCWRVSLCNTQARIVNLIHSVLRDDEDVTQAHDCLRHEADRGFERWHCTIYCLECCTGFNDAKRQHLSPLTQTATCPLPRYRSKHIAENSQWVSPTTNSLTALLAKGERVRLREVVNTCTERRTEKCIQRTAWILSHVLHTTQCERFVPRRMTQWAVYYNALVPVRTYLSI